MPMRLNVGVCRKIGLPEYSSVGATCNVEIELFGSLLQDDIQAFHQQVRTAYDACRQAVSDELAKHQSMGSDTNCSGANTQIPPESTASQQNGNGHNGNGGRQVTDKQLTYIRQLGSQVKGFGARRLDKLTNDMFGKPLAGLTSLEASGLIDHLKCIKAGELDLQAVPVSDT